MEVTGSTESFDDHVLINFSRPTTKAPSAFDNKE